MDWCSVSDVSGQPVGLIFRSRTVQELLIPFIWSFTLQSMHRTPCSVPAEPGCRCRIQPLFRFAHSYECSSSLPNYYLLLHRCTYLSMTLHERWGIKLRLLVPWERQEFSSRITSSIIMDFADALIHALKMEEQTQEAYHHTALVTHYVPVSCF